MIKHKSERHVKAGFTLLELLIVLAILAIVLSFIVPNFSFQNTEEVLSSDARLLHLSLQGVADQSWQEGSNTIISREADTSWKVWQIKNGRWDVSDSLYMESPELSIEVKTDLQAVKQATETLGFKKNGLFIFLSSGEYIPFSIVLTADEKVRTIQGDGINEITVQ